MTENEWQEAERRNPMRTYIELEVDRNYRRSTRLGVACFVAMPVTVATLMLCLL
jgi:hypothetical protein